MVSILTGYDAFADVCELADGTVMSSTCRLDGDREEIRSRAVAAPQ